MFLFSSFFLFFGEKDFHNVARKEMEGANGTKLGLGIFFWLKLGPSCHIMSEKKKSKVAMFRE